MDFTNRNQQNQVHRADGGRPASPVVTPSGNTDKPKKSRQLGTSDKWWRVGGIVFLFAVVILATALLVYIGFSNPSSQKYVDSDEYQAVFVNVEGTEGGQVYFGHIQNITNDYYRLTDVFYIQQSASNSKSSSSNLVLQKLGCSQIHDPEDQMIVNASQVLWWENINNDGQVAKQIANFNKQNPSGQNCSATQPATNSSSNNAQNSSNASSSSSSSSSNANSSDNNSSSNSSDSSNSSNSTDGTDNKQ